jgi:hypothetical protein
MLSGARSCTHPSQYKSISGADCTLGTKGILFIAFFFGRFPNFIFFHVYMLLSHHAWMSKKLLHPWPLYFFMSQYTWNLYPNQIFYKCFGFCNLVCDGHKGQAWWCDLSLACCMSHTFDCTVLVWETLIFVLYHVGSTRSPSVSLCHKEQRVNDPGNKEKLCSCTELLHLMYILFQHLIRNLCFIFQDNFSYSDILWRCSRFTTWCVSHPHGASLLPLYLTGGVRISKSPRTEASPCSNMCNHRRTTVFLTGRESGVSQNWRTCYQHDQCAWGNTLNLLLLVQGKCAMKRDF